MRRSFWTILALVAFVAGTPRVAAADTISIGFLSFDLDTLVGGSSTFDITNLTGQGIDGYPDTLLSLTVTGLTADISGGGTLTIPANDFTTVDAFDDVNCTVLGDAAAGGCNFAAYALSSATLMGTLSPTTGLAGLPPGFVGITSAFTATLLPLSGPTLTGGDFVSIDATLVPATTTPVPEPSTGVMFAIGIVGLLAASGAERRTRLARRLGLFRN